MEPWHSEYLKSDRDLVEAIEEGKIVRVTERYARLEGLPVLRKTKIELQTPKIQTLIKNKQEQTLSLDDLRKPLKPNQVTSELIDNFHWEISKRRRQLYLTRKQLADKINEPENNLKLIENGVIPANDFKIINKIQNMLQINLRKDQKDFAQSPRSLLKESTEKVGELEEKPFKEIIGEEIEILEDKTYSNSEKPKP